MTTQPFGLARPRILHLEDDAADGELTESALRAEWPLMQIERVENGAAFEAALAGRDFDVVLSDYTIPGFSGLAGLERVRVLKPQIPYIFFSGTIGEDNAAEALKRGAADYVIKDRPGRLIPAVRRALEAARGREGPDFLALADGLAHHFNNAFGPILLALPALRQLAIGDPLRGLLDTAEISARRGSDLARRLQAFARGEKMELDDLALEAAPPAQAEPARELGRQRSILVIDDEECLRKVTKVILEASGYRVFLAADGADGVEAYRARRTEIDAVLTDITMPVMPGTEVIRQLRTLNPDVRIVAMSGLDDPAGFATGDARQAFLRKPMKTADLLRALRDVMASPASLGAEAGGDLT